MRRLPRSVFGRPTDDRPFGLGFTVVAIVAAALGVDVGGARATTFADHLSTAVERPLAEAIAQSIGRSIPVPAASTGLVFEYDVETGAFARSTTIRGQTFLESPTTIGRHRWDVSLAYQRVSTDTLEGHELDDLSDTSPPIVDDPSDPHSATYTIPRFDVSLVTDETILTGTYGVTDDLEVSLTVPVLYSDFHLDARLHAEGGGGMSDRVRSTKLGVGDILLRGKYRLPAPGDALAAFGLAVRFPSGNEDNFQGTGAYTVSPLLYLSYTPVSLGSWFALVPYFNGGVDLDADDVGQSAGRWAVGLDGAITDEATIGLAVLAAYPFARIAPPGAFDFVRENPRTGNRFTAPVFGLSGGRPSIYDLSVGGRVNLWHHWLIGFASVLLPLNDDGFRSNAVPLFGIEAAF